MTEMTKADALLIASMACFNEIPSKRVSYLKAIEVKSTYDLAARIDRYMREKFGKNAHELTDRAIKRLKGLDDGKAC